MTVRAHGSVPFLILHYLSDLCAAKVTRPPFSFCPPVDPSCPRDCLLLAEAALTKFTAIWNRISCRFFILLCEFILDCSVFHRKPIVPLKINTFQYIAIEITRAQVEHTSEQILLSIFNVYLHNFTTVACDLCIRI
ncbi:hypothetical protein AHF37_08952 [Paragonimus kellicotti]|nr:hypothetical protein AHF37_08952 [Paragonimus kellicotti]